MIVLYIYIIITLAVLIGTAIALTEMAIEGIDNFWDYLIYCILWIVLPIKALFKYIKRLFK